MDEGERGGRTEGKRWGSQTRYCVYVILVTSWTWFIGYRNLSSFISHLLIYIQDISNSEECDNQSHSDKTLVLKFLNILFSGAMVAMVMRYGCLGELSFNYKFKSHCTVKPHLAMMYAGFVWWFKSLISFCLLRAGREGENRARKGWGREERIRGSTRQTWGTGCTAETEGEGNRGTRGTEEGRNGARQAEVKIIIVILENLQYKSEQKICIKSV